MAKKKKQKDIKSEQQQIELKDLRLLKDIILPQNVNPLPDDHIQIINGRKVYARTLYVSDMPRRSSFADTFEPLFKYGNNNTSIFANPLREGKAVSGLDKRITDLEVEEQTTQDSNRKRKLRSLLHEAESLSDAISAGENALFEVTILTTIYADTYEELEKITDDIRSKCREKGVILSIPYAYQEEAFLSNLPLNNCKLKYNHLMDKLSLSTMFHYTENKFGHTTGASLGINRSTGEVVPFNLFDPTLNGYNVVISGMTRSGKSTTVKALAMRSDTVDCFISLDPEGEYGKVAVGIGGVDLKFSRSTNDVINIFEVDIEYVRDEATGIEMPVLDLQEKISIATNNILTLARGAEPLKCPLNDVARTIITEVTTKLYSINGFIDGNVDSLYEVVNGEKRKRKMPTLSEWYRLFIRDDIENSYNNEVARPQYLYLKMVMKQYCRDFGGTKLYFDGQSTISLDVKDYPFINFDIKALNEKTERPIMQTILMDWMWETCFKKNSEDPLKALKLIAFFDETHHLLPYPEARQSLTNFYRRAAKKNVGIISATQKINDYMQYEDAHAIFTNADTKIILRHDESERKALKELLSLTPIEINEVLSANKGDLLIKCGSSKASVKLELHPSELYMIETDMNKLRALEERKIATGRYY